MSTLSLILRLLLGAILLFYGMGKVVQNQFTLPAFAFGMPLGDLPSRTLAWAFFGHSGWFQVLMGLLECVPAAMLFFHRSWRLGAVLLVPVLTGVVLVNFAFGLWLATKLLSSALLLMDLAILAIDWPRWRQILSLLMEPSPGTPRRLRTASIVSMVVLAITVAGIAVVVRISSSRIAPLVDFLGDVESRGAGAFVLESATVSGQPTPPPAEPVYLYFNSERNLILQTGGKSQRSKFSAQHADSTFTIDKLNLAGISGAVRGTYSVQGNSALLLTGAHDGRPIEWRLKRRWPPAP